MVCVRLVAGRGDIVAYPLQPGELVGKPKIAIEDAGRSQAAERAIGR
jgi:hypothetical protein